MACVPSIYEKEFSLSVIFFWTHKSIYLFFELISKNSEKDLLSNYRMSIFGTSQDRGIAGKLNAAHVTLYDILQTAITARH